VAVDFRRQRRVERGAVGKRAMVHRSDRNSAVPRDVEATRLRVVADYRRNARRQLRGEQRCQVAAAPRYENDYALIGHFSGEE
jgi:hypothetical protein